VSLEQLAGNDEKKWERAGKEQGRASEGSSCIFVNSKRVIKVTKILQGSDDLRYTVAKT
jgi:hypothetical protein